LGDHWLPNVNRTRLAWLAGTALAILLSGAPASAVAAVSVFPIPGDRVASPQTQIAFRGISYARLLAARIRVTGSRSGAHPGVLAPDSDGHGGSFLPRSPFRPGETVTVATSLPVMGGRAGTFRFSVAFPAGQIGFRPVAKLPRVRGDVWQFRSAPGLQASAVTIIRQTGPTAPGDFFLAPQIGPVQYGPEIVDARGNLVWSQPAPANDEVTDFETQTYFGRPVLTWWQGNVNGGCGRGVDVVYNTSYEQVATVRAANGQMADLHEFRITPANTALITAYYPVYWDTSSVHGPKRRITLDGVVQEIDIRTGLVLFQWDSLDHVPVSDAYVGLPGPKMAFDYFHVNSVDLDDDGNLILSARNTWAAYKISHQNGAILWTLGGKRSSFEMGPGTQFAFAHDVRVRSSHDLFISLFDDGGGPPTIHGSRGLKLFLDFRHKKVTLAGQYPASPSLPTLIEGNAQQLPDQHYLVGWGSQPYFSEFTANGRQILLGRFVDGNASYRIYRFPWYGSPQQPPSIATSARGTRMVVYASWNGATAVLAWRVLAGGAPNTLAPTATKADQGFETAILSRAGRYVAVQALGAKGRVLTQSATVAAN
jgi:Arylsulfotransferase (ASST)